MSGLSGLLSQTGAALNIFQQALTVVQNNISNAQTPGYASQRLNIAALPLDLAGGLDGGIYAQGVRDSRDQFAEEAVQTQTQMLGRYTAQAQSTGTIQNFFDVSGTSGVPGALTSLFQSFSAWSTSASDAGARQAVISAASNAATSIRQFANSLSGISSQIDGQIDSTVTAINGLVGQIQQYNKGRMESAQADPAADAQLYSNLESLAQLTDFTAVRQSDGTVSVMLAGGESLVTGTTVHSLSVSSFVDQQPAPANPLAPATVHITDPDGADIASQITGGKLGGLLDTRNRVLASFLGDGQQQGSLNQLAQTLADTVNGILTSGTVSTGAGAAKGTALFTYSAVDPTAVAATLDVDPAFTPDQLAPVDKSGNSNGNALALADLANAASIGGASFVQFYSKMAASIGQENSNASSSESAQTQVLAQAKSLRDAASGVSLDEQAVQVLEFQRAYQACAQVLSVVNTLAQAALNIIPNA